MIVVVSRTIIIKAISIPIIQNRIRVSFLNYFILAQFMLWHTPFFYRDVSISFK